MLNGLGPAVALDGPAHHFQPLPSYRRAGLVDRAGVALGVVVHEPLLLLDLIEDLARPPHSL